MSQFFMAFSVLQMKLMKYLAALTFLAYLGITHPSNQTVEPSSGTMKSSETPTFSASSLVHLPSPLQLRLI